MNIKYSSRAFAVLGAMKNVERGADRVIAKEIGLMLSRAGNGSGNHRLSVSIDNTKFKVNFSATVSGQQATITALSYKI